MKSEKRNILLSAGILGLGTFFVKFIGAIYRIPLTNILKSDGIGLYQMVFPVYALLLDFSGASVPSALSKLIAEKGENSYIYAKKYLLKCIKFFGVVGILATSFILSFSKVISRAQGNENAKFAYLFLAPAIFFVCIISCYRGAFQGLKDMKPTAISQIIEQVVKVVLGLLLATFFISNTPLAVGGATLAITVSEICAVIYLAFLWKKREKKYFFQNGKEISEINEKELSIKTILKAVIPITLIGITMPFSQVIDSFLIVNLLKNTNNATGIYGIYSGVSLTIINLPISICHGLAVATVPSVSSAKDTFDRRDKEKYLIKITLIISLIASVFVLFLSKPLVNILFSSLPSEDKNLAIKLIKTLSVVIVLLSLLQTQNSIFIANGKYYVPLITMFISVVVKSILEYFLIKNQYLNIFGGAISLITCYFIANLLNFILIKDFGANNAGKKRKYPEFEN